MQVKVFEAADMASGLRKIRRELGPDALILSTRTIKNGKFGLLGKESLEITAAVDNQWPEKKMSQNPSSIGTNGYNAARTYESNAQTPPEPQQPEINTRGFHQSLNGIAAAPASSGQDEPARQEIPKHSVQPDDPALRREFDELKSMVKSLAGEISRLSTPERQEDSPPASNTLLSALEQKLRSSKSNTEIEDILFGRGVNQETARTIATFAQEHLSQSDLADNDAIICFLQDTIADIFTTKTVDFSSEAEQKRMAFLGPTGVGKTTTLAKIAARYLATGSRSAALVTIDTYRIAAVEQLKVYGEIMHLPVEVVITPRQMAEALEKHSDKELILIDTAGRSPLDSVSLEEIQSFLPAELSIENHLVLSATTRDSELLETLKKFKNFHIDSTIFTKIDECASLGVLLNTQIQNSSPLSFVTNGQRVPEDILAAEKKQLAQLIVPSPNGIVHD